MRLLPLDYGGRCSFWVGRDVHEVVSISLAIVVKAPGVVDPGVEPAVFLVELCGVKRRVPRVAEEMRELLAKALLDLRGSLEKARDEGISQNGAHDVPVG